MTDNVFIKIITYLESMFQFLLDICDYLLFSLNCEVRFIENLKIQAAMCVKFQFLV